MAVPACRPVTTLAEQDAVIAALPAEIEQLNRRVGTERNSSVRPRFALSSAGLNG